MKKLYYNTVTDTLSNILKELMANPTFNDFNLVGGTALSLQLGHRKSVDIDLFTDIEYGTMDTATIKKELTGMFPYSENLDSLEERGFGYTLRVGNSKEDSVKLDIYYTDPFIFPIENIDGIRLASSKEIAAMKMGAILTRDAVKDYWDIHELFGIYKPEEIIQWGIDRSPYTVSEAAIMQKLSSVNLISETSPVDCLKGKYWDLIQLDLKDAARNLILNKHNISDITIEDRAGSKLLSVKFADKTSFTKVLSAEDIAGHKSGIVTDIDLFKKYYSGNTKGWTMS